MSNRLRARANPARPGRIAAMTALLLCGVTLLFAYLNKARCAGAPFESNGRSAAFDHIKDGRVCYSDIQFLWLGRDINEHVFPYLTGGITTHGALTGGAVEYPVLSGLLMWLGAIGAHTDATFLLHSALLLAPFALLTAWMLGRLSGMAALLWAAGPPLVLYAFHNWELPVVCTSVGAVYVVTTLTRYSVRTRGVLAAILLGVGFCLKLYPGIFVLPLMIHVLVGGSDGLDALRHRSALWRAVDPDGGVPDEDDAPTRHTRRYDVRGAVMVAATAVATAVLINLPFALIGYQGWRASITFQELRQADITSNSIWFWGLRPLFGDTPGGERSYQDVVATASPMLVVCAFGLAMWLGWRRYRVGGMFPWVGVSGAMLCGFLLLHKVHSPQYTLWLIPFLVLLEIPWSVVVAYLLADASLGIGIFRYFHALGAGSSADFEKHLVLFGVWGRALLLVYLFFAFVYLPVRGQRRAEPARSRYSDDELIPASS
ncbi:glycosyltransferase family 87 protein [Nocardia macrotermitis]